MLNKKKLAIELSKLSSLDNKKINLEQYILDSEIAAELILIINFNNDIKDNVIADLGCGNGILGKGCLFFNPEKVYFVDKDKDAIDIVKKNVKDERAVFVNKDIKDFNKKADVVIMNPPFGTKVKYADREFLLKAMQISKKIYSLHKITSVNFIEKIARDNSFKVLDIIRFKLPLRRSYLFHRKEVRNVDVGFWILEKEKI